MSSAVASGTGTPVAALGSSAAAWMGRLAKGAAGSARAEHPERRDAASADTACGPVGSVLAASGCGSVRAIICAAAAPGLGGVRGRGAETTPAGAGGATSAVAHVSGAGVGRSSVGAAGAGTAGNARRSTSGSGEAAGCLARPVRAGRSLAGGLCGRCARRCRDGRLRVVLRGARLDQRPRSPAPNALRRGGAGSGSLAPR